MKIAIPVWQDNISNVFDFADKLWLAEIDGQTEKNRTEIALPNEPALQRADRLKELDIDVLICGAISKYLAFLVMSTGIKVIPFVSGKIDEVLSAHINGRLSDPRFLMPGCLRGARKGFIKGGRHCRWRGGL